VSVATQVVVPLVLSALSLFIARRALHEAARTVRSAGHAAVDGMRRTRGWLYGDGAAAGASRPAEDPRVRVEPAPTSGRARVSDEVPADEQDDLEEERQRHHL
jgi:hypothetical protein